MGKSITPRKKGRALPPDMAAATAPDGFVTLAIDTDESWTFDTVTFPLSKSGGNDRGYADKIRKALADRCKIDKAEVTVSIRRAGDDVTVVAWRKTPTDDADDTANVVTDDADTDDADDGDDA